VGELGGQYGRAVNQFQAAVVHALDAPFQVMDVDLDVIGDGIGSGPGKLRGMAAVFLPREFAVELHDTTVDRLQLQDLRRRWPPRHKRHAFEIFQNGTGVHGVGLGPLHACSSKILDRSRVDHHHLHVPGMVQGERELQAVDPGRFQTHPRRVPAFGRPPNEFPVPSRSVRKRRQRRPLLRALHHANQLLRIDINPDLIDLLHDRSRTTLNSGSPDLAPLLNRPCNADCHVCDTPRYWQRRRGADLTNRVQAFRRQRPPRRTHSFRRS
jgi:hypothetical protein